MCITNYEESTMAAHRMEFSVQSEISTNYEAEQEVSPSLQRQLGRATFEGLHLANPVETHPYTDLELKLNHSIVGQPDAVRCTVNALNRDELRNPNRPRAIMLYLGPTGVGKTQTARELSRHLHPDDDNAYLRIDCSMFAQPHTVGRLRDMSVANRSRFLIQKLSKRIKASSFLTRRKRDRGSYMI